jgi:uncharacterized membrane protein YphA (DoxX/SURF4 family)
VDAPLASAPPPWRLARDLGERFLLAYWTLAIFPFPVGEHHWPQFLISWFARRVLQMERPVLHHPSGSGDTLFDWVSLAFTLVLAAVGALLWARFGRRLDPRRARPVVRVYVRYYLAAMMLSYGAFKVLPSQFPPNQPPHLMEPFGCFSPMSALWSFMGASAAYTIAAGLGEVAGGLLLLFRRTTSVGALLLLGVMGQVVLLNLCYDVPVKLFSAHLWLMALFLAWPDLRLIYEALVRRRPVQPPAVDWQPARPRWRLAVRIAKALVVVGLLVSSASQGWSSYRQWGVGRVPPAVEGLWDVDGEAGDPPPWRRLGIGSWHYAVSPDDGDPCDLHGLTHKDGALTLRTARGDVSFKVRMPDRDHLVLDGPYQLRLHRVPPAEVWLTGRGFHWIQEYPLNR